MSKTILITGATDGIGLEAAKMMAEQGHKLILHGRNANKLEGVRSVIESLSSAACVESYIADLSSFTELKRWIDEMLSKHSSIDVLINNAGVLKTKDTVTAEGLDIRFMVNTIAPYILAQAVLPLLAQSGRIINVSSATQVPVNLKTLTGELLSLSDMDAYAQSKLGLTMWSRHMALANSHASGRSCSLVVVAVNPGSLLGTKMVKEGFGVSGGDIQIGATILTQAALGDMFIAANGQYFDNDSGQFTSPHIDALDEQQCSLFIAVMEGIIERYL